MHITQREIAEALADMLGRRPTAKELSKFKKYLALDIPQWLKDNAKSFVLSRNSDE